MRKILILDDVRGIKQAFRDVSFERVEGDLVWLCRPFRHDGMSVQNDYEDAISVVLNNPTMDMWVLDNDLGPGVEGFKFLQEMIESYPDKVPDCVVSCSANPIRRAAIESYHADWVKSKSAEATVTPIQWMDRRDDCSGD